MSIAQYNESARSRATARRGAASDNPYLLPVVEFALETAMRRGEILSLVWEHVDLERRTALLPET